MNILKKIAFILIFIYSCCFAQHFDYIGQSLFKGSCFDPICIIGNYIYCTPQNYGDYRYVHIISLENPDSPATMGYLNIHMIDIAVQGDYAFVACADSTLRVFNVDIPYAPVQVTELPISISHIYIEGNYAFCSIPPDSGLQIIDISNPEVPILSGFCACPTGAIAVQNNYAYIAAYDNGMQIIDITNPSNPSWSGDYATLSPAQDIEIIDNYVYMACGLWNPEFVYGHLMVIDITNPLIPNLVRTFYHYDNHIKHILASGNYAYLTYYYGYLDILNTSIPANPSLISHFFLESSFTYGLDFFSNYLLVGSYTPALTIIDISDPINPVLHNYFEPGPPRVVNVIDSIAFIASNGDGNLYALNVIDPVNPGIISTFQLTTWGGALDIDVKDNKAFLAEGWGLTIIDISDPTDPNLLGNFSDGNYVLSASSNANFAYISGTYYSHNQGYFKILNITDPQNPSILGNYIGNPGSVYGEHYVVQSIAYVVGSDSNVIILDISDPTSPNQIGLYSTPNAALDVIVEGDYAFVNVWHYGLLVLNISDPTNPVFVGNCPLPPYSEVSRLFIEGQYIFIAAEFYGIYAIDKTNPENPVLVSNYDTDGRSIDVFVLNNYVYVADYRSFLILRFDPETEVFEEITQFPYYFTLNQNYPNPFNARTRISLQLSSLEPVKIGLYDLLGRRLQSVFEGVPRDYHLDFDIDLSSNEYSSGIYFIVAEQGPERRIVKSTLLK